MDQDTCLIIGAGQAASQLAFSLRKEGWQGGINIIGTEASIPYQKPTLSKGFLSGEKNIEEIAIKKAALYDKKDIELTSGTSVLAIDREAKQLTLANGEIRPYHKLAICTGASARQLNIEGKEKNNIFYLNTLSDAQGVKNFIDNGSSGSAVIIGGGFIGLEVASCLRKKGLKVTIIEAAERILARVSAPETSAYFTELHQDNGVEFVTGVQAERFVGDHDVAGVACNNGQVYEGDVVIVGIGVSPNTALAEAAGLAVDNGIVVNEFAVTSDPDIVAAGDCTVYHDSSNDSKRRVESIQNAMMQAKNAATYLCRGDKYLDELPWFWSDQYDAKLQIAGLNNSYTHTRCRNEADGKQFSLWYFNNERLLAVDCINHPKAFLFAKKAIVKNLQLDQAKIHDGETPLESLLLETQD